MSNSRESNRGPNSSVRLAHRGALRWGVMAWIVSLCFIFAVQVGWPTMFRWSPWDAVAISVGSLLVSCLSLAPGLRFGRSSTSYHHVIFSGITIRLLGTVALFLTCRYQLASSAEVTAGMTIGWYALLTSVEVYALSRFQPKSIPVGMIEVGPLSPINQPFDIARTPDQQNV